jgi:hypothetical protein
MMRKWLLTIAILLLSLPSGRAGLIPNGDFETGDFTDWLPQSSSGPLGTATAAVEFLDGSYRAVLKLDIPSGLRAANCFQQAIHPVGVAGIGYSSMPAIAIALTQ